MIRWLLALACAGLLAAQQPDIDHVWDLLAKGQRAEAVRVLNAIILSNPPHAEARLMLGSILFEDGRNAEAITQLREAVRLAPRSADAHNALGEAFYAAGESKSARPEFEKAIELDPLLAPARVSLALIQLEAGEFAPAARHLDRALELMGKSSDAAFPHYLRAKVYSHDDEIEKAAAELSQAVALRPDLAEAWADLGLARKSLLDEDGAFAAYRRAVELAPDNAISQYRLGVEYMNRGDVPSAVRHLQESYRLNPENQSTLNSLQLALRRDGQVEAANAIRKKLAELLRKIDTESQNAFTALRLNNEGAELEKAGNLPGALEKYRAAVALDPEHTGFRTNLGAALLRLGRWDEGVAELKEVLRREPDNAKVKAALKAVQAARPR